MKKILFVFTFFCVSNFLNAQKYISAIGARVGTDFGLSVQQKVLDHSTIEGIFQTNLGGRDDISLTFLWEQHQKIIGKGINFYYGAGLHKGWLVKNDPELNLKAPSGVSLIAGIEVTLGRLNLSLDYKPQLNVISGERFYDSQSALSIRYVLIEAKKKKKRWLPWKKNKK